MSFSMPAFSDIGVWGVWGAWGGWLFGAVGAVAAVTDYRSGKIYNWLTLPALVIAIALAAFAGRASLAQAALGLAVATALFLPLYLTGVLGGGDVKLLMALGTWLGPRGTLELAMASILIAGAGAVALLVKHGRVRAFCSEIWVFARTVFTPGLEIQWPRLRRDIKAPFGIAIFLGFLCVLMQ